MIRYALVCEHGHRFESWFPSSDSYDAQAARGLVTCPICDTVKVGKAPMSPRLARTDTIPEASAPVVPMISEPEQRMRAMLRAVREHVTANSEAVGERFPEEARKIHYGESAERSIYGQASLEEARALIDEGIGVAPLPILPDDRN